MPVRKLAEMTFEEVATLDPTRTIAILPIGATEAHGPHLPLATDVIISEAMVEAGATILAKRGVEGIVLPSMAYTAARYADGFAGTVSIAPETATSLIVDIARGVARSGIQALALANSHLDPAHIDSIHRAVELCETEQILTAIYPDITRKPWARRLTDEFKSGACHAGQFEGSIVMAARPDLVREKIRLDLPDNPASLSDAIRSGLTTFEEAGGPKAYFGYPSRATATEGKETIEELGRILADAVLAEPIFRSLGSRDHS